MCCYLPLLNSRPPRADAILLQPFLIYRKQAGSSPDQAQSSHPSLPVQDGTIHIEKVDEGGRDDSVNAAVSGQHEQRRAVEMRSGGGVRSGRSGVGSRESDDVMTVQNF